MRIATASSVEALCQDGEASYLQYVTECSVSYTDILTKIEIHYYGFMKLLDPGGAFLCIFTIIIIITSSS